MPLRDLEYQARVLARLDEYLTYRHMVADQVGLGFGNAGVRLRQFGLKFQFHFTNTRI